jgi:hypothetical protein
MFPRDLYDLVQLMMMKHALENKACKTFDLILCPIAAETSRLIYSSYVDVRGVAWVPPPFD